MFWLVQFFTFKADKRWSNDDVLLNHWFFFSCNSMGVVMKYSDFKMVKVVGDSLLTKQYLATVTETKTTSFLWWKKETKTKREVFRKEGLCWRFLDNGKYCPGLVIENLAEAYEAKKAFQWSIHSSTQFKLHGGSSSAPSISENHLRKIRLNESLSSNQ